MADIVVDDSHITFNPLCEGFSSLSGTLKIAGSPDIPVARDVAIFGEFGAKADGALRPTRLQLLTTTQSDSSGDWIFHGLNPERKYTVIGYDDTYAPTIGGGLTCDT